VDEITSAKVCEKCDHVRKSKHLWLLENNRQNYQIEELSVSM